MRPRRTRAINRLLALAAFGWLLTAGTGVARADGVLSASEAEYVATYGEFIVCAQLSASPTPETVMAVVANIMSDGLFGDSAVDVVNASVAVHCDELWPLLQRTGQIARGEAARYLT